MTYDTDGGSKPPPYGVISVYPLSYGFVTSVVDKQLVGTNEQVIYQNARTLLADPAAYKPMSQASNPYGNGRASARIADAIYDSV